MSARRRACVWDCDETGNGRTEPSMRCVRPQSRSRQLLKISARVIFSSPPPRNSSPDKLRNSRVQLQHSAFSNQSSRVTITMQPIFASAFGVLAAMIATASASPSALASASPSPLPSPVGSVRETEGNSIVDIVDNGLLRPRPLPPTALPKPNQSPRFPTPATPSSNVFTTRPNVNRTAFVMPPRPIYPPEEEAALKAIRPKVEHLIEIEPWMDNHIRETVMLKFLRARNLNVDAAANMMLNTLAWRNATDFEKLLTTDFTKWEKLFPFIISGEDRQHRPEFLIFLSAYDIRKAVIAGHYNTLVQLYDRSFEIGFRKSIGMYAETGKNTALEGFMIIDATGFNLRQHACLSCLPIYIHIVQSFENYYPQTLHKVIIINAPPTIEVVLRVIRPFMSSYTKKALEVYGVDKQEWMPVLEKYVTPDQLLERFGGTRKLTAENSLILG